MKTNPAPGGVQSTVPPEPSAAEGQSFAETALKLGGKSDEEARRTGAIDKADDTVEALFAPQYQTTASPVHRAVWDDSVPVELFHASKAEVPGDVARVMEDSLAIVRRHRDAKTLLDAQIKITPQVLSDLGAAGYWGLLVDRAYGGSGAPFSAFAQFLTRMAMIDPTVAGMASVHGCIGAVDPVRTFGSPEQKQRLLPGLASGQRLSAFALTEPCAGSDLTALRTRAELVGDHYVVNGEKLFITNVQPGRTIGLVCIIDKRPAVLIVDLPPAENENFQLKRYGLYALKHTHNLGIIFRDFKVPAENLLRPPRGDGLTIAYHGLNLGRVALCATAAGSMRIMLAGMLPWAQFRRTYGAPIATRELVQRRLARMAALIVGADALVAWCSGLIDQGYRGEMECIIAKIFGSEAQKEAAIELCMKTHGGRSFLHGHLFGDNVHEFLAPCIYEGEGEMLGMAFFKSLIKHHGMEFFEPIGKQLAAAGIRTPNMADPRHAWVLREPLTRYARWYMHSLVRRRRMPSLPAMPTALRSHAAWAIHWLESSRFEITSVLRKHQLKLADRQCRMAEISARVQSAIIVLATALYAGQQNDELVQQAADMLCRDTRRALTGARASDSDLRAAVALGARVAEGNFTPLAGVTPQDVLMPYQQQ